MSIRLVIYFSCALALAGSNSIAAAGTASNWQTLSTGLSDTSSAQTVTLQDRDLRQAELSADEIRGHWVRLSGRVADSAVFSKFTLRVFSGEQVVGYATPTVCSEKKGPSYCESLTWVPSDATRVQASVYSEVFPAVISALRVERSAEDTPIQTGAWVRMSGLIATIRDMYYLSRDVDWHGVRERTLVAMAAPADIDPVPGTLQYVIANLPGHQHTMLESKSVRDYLVATVAKDKGEDGVLPSCTGIGPNTWQLVLPTTYTLSGKLHQAYIRQGTRCLLKQPPTTNWVIDLRGNGGGSSNLTIGAIAPLFGTGLLYSWVNGTGDVFQVSMAKAGVVTHDRSRAGVVHDRAQEVGARRQVKVIAWIGPECASACEATAVALLGRPNTTLIGQKTAGLATGNEMIPVSAEYNLILTAGRMKSKAGRMIGDSIDPQIATNSENIAEILSLAAWPP